MTRLLRDNEIEVVAAVSDGEALVREVMARKPDVAVVDIRLPPNFRDEGLRAALEVRRRAPGTAVLVVSQYVEPTYAEELLADRGGGVGYLLKDRVMHVAISSRRFAASRMAEPRSIPRSSRSCSPAAARMTRWTVSHRASARCSR